MQRLSFKISDIYLFTKSIQALCYIVIQAMAIVSMNQIKKKVDIINTF